MKRNRGAPATARPRAGVATIDIVVASRLWTEQRSVKALLRRAIREAASATSTLMGEIAIVLTDDSARRAQLLAAWKRQLAHVVHGERSGPHRAAAQAGLFV